LIDQHDVLHRFLLVATRDSHALRRTASQEIDSSAPEFLTAPYTSREWAENTACRA
jgi:hypothetical protein